MEQNRKITTSFNVLLILYSAASGVFTFALSDAAKDVPVTGIVMTSLVDFVRFLVMMFAAAYFAREVWNGCVPILRTSLLATPQQIERHAHR
jgi:hypothetical protein